MGLSYSSGRVVEWLHRGLQNPVHRFNSGRGLQKALLMKQGFLLSMIVFHLDRFCAAVGKDQKIAYCPGDVGIFDRYRKNLLAV